MTLQWRHQGYLSNQYSSSTPVLIPGRHAPTFLFHVSRLIPMHKPPFGVASRQVEQCVLYWGTRFALLCFSLDTETTWLGAGKDQWSLVKFGNKTLLVRFRKRLLILGFKHVANSGFLSRLGKCAALRHLSESSETWRLVTKTSTRTSEGWERAEKWWIVPVCLALN